MESVQTDTGGASTDPQAGEHDTMGACSQFHAASEAANDARDNERERCAKLAEGNWVPESNSLSPEYVLRHKIATEIRGRK